MPWWETILFLIAVGLALWGFASMTGVYTRFFTRKTTRTAQDLYASNADSPRKQRRYAREHGGNWTDRR
ncbi:MAG TPA: hypothetical protein VGJ19_22065 [Streptosporangiaceae bacterium]